MKIRIEDGKTIISTGVKSGDPLNKTGVKGLTYKTSTGKYSLAHVHNGKKYHLGNYATLEDAKAIRKILDEHIEQGTFEQWFEAFAPKRSQNKYGVKGLNKKGNMYQLNISVNGTKYFLGSFSNVEDAGTVRAAAEQSIKDGTFNEWLKTLKIKHKGNELGVPGLSKYFSKYHLAVTYKKKKYHIASYSTIEEAKLVREEADRHIADGTFEEWYKGIKKA